MEEIPGSSGRGGWLMRAANRRAVVEDTLGRRSPGRLGQAFVTFVALSLCAGLPAETPAQAQEEPRPALGTGVPGEERLSPTQIRQRLELYRQKKREMPGTASADDPAAAARKSDGWVGLVLHTRAGLAFVKRVVPGWPAALAGLKPGDQIVSVDGMLAGAPRLEAALDRLAGPAGGAVEVTVHRPGEPTPLVLRVVRTDRPPPDQPPSRPLSPAASPYKPLDEALERFSRGEKSALDAAVAKLVNDRPADAAEVYLRAVRGVLELGGDDAQYKAVQLAFHAVEQYAIAPQTPELVRLVYPPGTRDGADMRDLAGKALDQLENLEKTDKLEASAASRSPEVIEAIRRWKMVQALGWVRDRKMGRALKLMRRALEEEPTHLLAMRPDGTVIWRAPVSSAQEWQDLVETALAAGKKRQAWEALEQALRLDEPPWVYNAVAMLKGQKGIPARPDMLEPRWPIQRSSSELTVLKSPDGVRADLKSTLNGRAAAFLRCSPEGDDCESWRLALSAALEEQEPIDALVAIVVQGAAAEAQSGVLPTYTLPASATLTAGFPVVQVLDPDGRIVAAYGAYEPGLEQRVLDQLRTLQKEPDAGGPYLVRGGWDLGLWDMRWFRSDPPVSWAAMSGPQHPVSRLWLMSPPDRLELMEEGEIRRAISGLTGIDRVFTVELDKSPSEELLIYRHSEGLLEAINGAGIPRWIIAGERPIDQLVPADLDGDGRDEVLITFQGDNDLHCYSPDGARKWSYRLPAGARSVAVGNIVDKGRVVVAASRAGHLHLLSPKGESRGEIETSFRVQQVALADLDGDGNDEVLAGDAHVADLVAADLNGDRLPEIIARAGSRQLLIYHPDGNFTSRMTLEIDSPHATTGDFDGDGQRELMLLSGSNTAAILSWSIRADETSLVPSPKKSEK